MIDISLIERAVRVIEMYALCDHCLGRLFARVGYGLENYERGRALKDTIYLLVHHKLRSVDSSEEQRKLLELILKLAESGHEPSIRYLRENLGVNVQVKSCSICGGKYFGKIDKLAELVLDKLKDFRHEFKSYYVGSRLPKEVIAREVEITTSLGIDTAESIKRELNRLLGKKLREYLKDKEFKRDNADLEIIVDFEREQVELDVKPLYLYCRYRKLYRGISQVQLRLNVVTSVQKVLNETIGKAVSAQEVIIHASGREDLDVRMLGDGRPLVIALIKPERRPEPEEFRKIVEETLVDMPVELELSEVKRAVKTDIVKLKKDANRHSKIYRVLVLLREDVSEEQLRSLENYFRNRQVTQYTPRRIRRKPPHKKRVRMVYELKARKLAPRLIELLIKCQGGLYVKELITGDEGRTNPSIADTLGVDAIPIELDVMDVLER